MKIYLVRHGDAENPLANSERPLTNYGEKQVLELAKKIKEKDFDIDEICHSGILRAQQTAQIIQKELGGTHSLVKVDDLLPESDIEIWFEKLSESKKNIMLVGHMPFMAFLGEALMKNQIELGFSTASMISFRYEDGEFHLDWNSQYK